MKQFFLLLLVTIFTFSCKSDVNTKPSTTKSVKPKLVIGIVIDQMRYDYLTRFDHRFGEGGFKRIINNGYNLKNTHLNYTPSKTAVGHASIYTGTTPRNHGIMGNDWYDKYEQKSVNNSDDDNYESVGSTTKNGQKSPNKLITNTIGDQLHLSQNMQGKVIGIAIKGRGSILPVGHSANASYWFDKGTEGKWVTSTYYMNSLPKWVSDFNNSKIAENYLNSTWDTYYDIDTYTNSGVDDDPHEQKYYAKEKTTFPYDLSTLKEKNKFYKLLLYSPQGNSMTTDFAMKAIESENLGKTEMTDFLALGYSSTDGIGHQFGPNSVEIEDAYIRMDLELERFLNFLDKQVGKGKYTIFLTADHGVSHIPYDLKELNFPGGYRSKKLIRKYVEAIVDRKFGNPKLIEHIENNSIFINEKQLKKSHLKREDVADVIAIELIKNGKIHKTATHKTLATNGFNEGMLALMQRGFNQKLSGDVMFLYTPSMLGDWNKNKGGSNHGSGYNYDNHIPLLFYGAGIKVGSSNHYYPITDIASTICTLMEIEFPNGNTGKVIEEVLE
ncbi:MAG: alkaline phosphatase family protein [Flavobacteriaceae bacterium]